MQSKVIAFDLDETLCYRPDNIEHLGKDKYQYSKPIEKNIKIVNSLYDAGHKIYIYTARGMSQYNGDMKKIYDELYDVTLQSLKEWGVKHHGLIMGKIFYDILVDDKVVNIKDINNEKDIENKL